MLKKFLTPPVFPGDPEKTRAARLLFQIILATWSLPFIGMIVGLLNPSASRFVLSAALALVVTLILLTILGRSGQIYLASTIIIAALVLIFIYLNYSTAGIRTPLILLSAVAILTSGLLLGKRAPIVVAIVLSLQNAVIVYLHANGIIQPIDTAPTPLQIILVMAVGYLLIGFTFQLAISRIQLVLNQIREDERSLQSSNRELQNLSASLEQRVLERTDELARRSQDLERANRNIQRRAGQFEAVAQVTQDITSIRDLRDLLPRVAAVISEKFDFYHVGVFLLDEVNEYAVLSATNSEGGRKMLERKHRLRVGEQGIVGNVTHTGIPRIAMDVGADAVFFDNPELPDTHSEMALPLKSGDLIIGALDVQSTERGAFTEEDTQMLSLLANQVSLAIENARLFEETRKALSESEAVSRQSTREVWRSLPTERGLIGYRYTLVGTSPLDEPIDVAEPANGKSKNTETETGRIVVPIELRGETIGTLVVQSPSTAEISQEQLDLIKAVAERVAISAENARLFDETTRRAERERMVSEITSKIRSVNDPQTMIQTAMEELRNALGASRVEVIPQKVRGADQ